MESTINYTLVLLNWNSFDLNVENIIQKDGTLN